MSIRISITDTWGALCRLHIIAATHDLAACARAYRNLLLQLNTRLLTYIYYILVLIDRLYILYSLMYYLLSICLLLTFYIFPLRHLLLFTCESWTKYILTVSWTSYFTNYAQARSLLLQYHKVNWWSKFYHKATG